MAVQTFIIIFSILAVVHSQKCQKPDEATTLEEYINNKIPGTNSRYRQQYHMSPPVGWMNDPNAFSYFGGKFHMFYQLYPYDTTPGRMHWGHFTSPDLVHWKRLPTALIPEQEQCFSGSAIVKDNNLILMYTGRETTNIEPFYKETQYLAASNDGIDFQKYEGNPVLSYTPNCCPDFRDPKVWKHGEHYYVILGSKSDDSQRGRVLLYRSLNMIDWEFLRVLDEAKVDGEYMWECPDLFKLNDRHILVYSPQQMKPDGDGFKKIDRTGYRIGKLNYNTYELTLETCFQDLDYGHDFYASQTTEVNGTRYLVAWLNSWDKKYPEAQDGWVGTLTVIRQLALVDDRIIMQPVDEMINLREEIVHNGTLCPNYSIMFEQTADIIIEADFEQEIEILITGRNGGDKVWLRWDPVTRLVVVDRDGDIRQEEWIPLNYFTWRLLLDAGSMELFCGVGELVFSSRVYPNGGWAVTNCGLQKLFMEAYKLASSVSV